MKQNESGSLSLMFMTFVAPMLMLLAGVAIEVSQFLGFRERVQDILDSEARVGLQRAYSIGEIEGRLRRRLNTMINRLRFESIRVSMTTNSNQIIVDGLYEGLFTQFLDGEQPPTWTSIPIHFESLARRPRTGALIVFDRGVEVGAPVCGNETLKVRARMATRLSEILTAKGISDVRIGVTPGQTETLQVLPRGSAPVDLPRCLNNSDDGVAGLLSVAGVEQDMSSDAVAVAYLAVSNLLALANEQREQLALVMVGGRNDESLSALTATFELLDGVAARQIRRVLGVGIVQTQDREEAPFLRQTGLEGGRISYLALSNEEMRRYVGASAVAEYIQGRTVIAR